MDGLPYGTTQHLAGAAIPIGYEVTQSSRTRRGYAVVASMLSAADKHISSLGKLRELCRMHDRQSGLFSGMINRGLDNIPEVWYSVGRWGRTARLVLLSRPEPPPPINIR